VSTAARKARKRAGIKFEHRQKTPTVAYVDRRRREPAADVPVTFSLSRLLFGRQRMVQPVVRHSREGSK
jgi:hypothetical protein